jgi:hypothetical protein
MRELVVDYLLVLATLTTAAALILFVSLHWTP